MNKRILMLLSISFLIAGCATTESTRRNEVVYHMYTNAPRDIVFDASCQALLSNKYSIDIKDNDNYLVKGTQHYTPAPGYSEFPLHAVIEVTEETGGAKATCSLGRPLTIARKELDIFGFWRRYADNIFNEMDKILVTQGYKSQKR